MAVDYTLKGTKAGYQLTDEQNDIVHDLIHNRRFFNCSQTGIGKTLSTLTAAIRVASKHKSKNIHFVLIIPNSAVKAFTDTLGNIIGVPYNIYTAKLTRTMENARFHIFNYNTLSEGLFTDEGRTATNHYFDLLTNLRKKHRNLWLIADEAHGLQDPTSNQFRMMGIIMPLFAGAWPLTATPILNDLRGFYEMVNLFVPGFFGSWWRFRSKYCILDKKEIWGRRRGKPYVIKTVKNIVGFKNLDHLQKEFARISIIRSKHYDVDLIYRSVELPENMAKYYKYAAAGLFSGTLNRLGNIKKGKQQMAAARLHDLQRVVSNSHAEFKLLKDPDKVTPKEKLLADTIKEVLARDEAVLIYFSYHETIDRIKYILDKVKGPLGIPQVHEVTGKISQKKRRLVEDGIGPRNVVLITSAGTESINLQKANNLIFYEIPFPIREFVQGCGRITRTNSTFTKFRVYILESEGTIDTYKKNRIVANSVPIKAVVGGSDVLPTEVLILNEEDRKAEKDKYLWWK